MMRTYSGELQYLFRSKYVNIIIGGGYFAIDRRILILREDLSFPIVEPPVFIGSFPEKIDENVDHTNVYLYSNYKPIENLTLTIGASGDFFDSESDITTD